MSLDNVNQLRANILHNGFILSPEKTAGIERVQVDHEINMPGMFQITTSLYALDKGSWSGVDLLEFKLGDRIDILMGTEGPIKVITGEITAIEPVFSENATLTIRGYDKLHRLRYGKYRRSFLEMKDSDIVTMVAGDASLVPMAEDTGTTHLYVFQNNISNYRFLLERAKRIGYELLCKEEFLIFRPSKEDMAPLVTLEYGISLINFSASLKSLTQGSSTEVRGWDVANKAEITATATTGSAKSPMKGAKDGYMHSTQIQKSDVAVVEYPVVDAADAEAMAKGMYNQMLQNFMSGEGEGPGNSKMMAGDTVELKGLGLGFSGDWYLTKTTHISDIHEGFTTRFKAKRTGA